MKVLIPSWLGNLQPQLAGAAARWLHKRNPAAQHDGRPDFASADDGLAAKGHPGWQCLYQVAFHS
jgi:hypothetical protein